MPHLGKFIQVHIHIHNRPNMCALCMSLPLKINIEQVWDIITPSTSSITWDFMRLFICCDFLFLFSISFRFVQIFERHYLKPVFVSAARMSYGIPRCLSAIVQTCGDCLLSCLLQFPLQKRRIFRSRSRQRQILWIYFSFNWVWRVVCHRYIIYVYYWWEEIFFQLTYYYSIQIIRYRLFDKRVS